MLDAKLTALRCSDAAQQSHEIFGLLVGQLVHAVEVPLGSQYHQTRDWVGEVLMSMEEGRLKDRSSKGLLLPLHKLATETGSCVQNDLLPVHVNLRPKRSR